jgi:hypothetical protein
VLRQTSDSLKISKPPTFGYGIPRKGKPMSGKKTERIVAEPSQTLIGDVLILL